MIAHLAKMVAVALTFLTSIMPAVTHQQAVRGERIDLNRFTVPTLGIDLPVIETTWHTMQDHIDRCEGAVRFPIGQGMHIVAAHRTSCGDRGFRGVDRMQLGDTATLYGTEYELVKSVRSHWNLLFVDFIDQIGVWPANHMLVQTSTGATTNIVHIMEPTT